MSKISTKEMLATLQEWINYIDAYKYGWDDSDHDALMEIKALIARSGAADKLAEAVEQSQAHLFDHGYFRILDALAAYRTAPPIAPTPDAQGKEK